MTRASIQECAQRARMLPADASDELAGDVLTQLRAALAQGLPASSDAEELRAYLSLADRFGFAADAWNAANLLAGYGPLDPLARLARTRAWLHLFPDVAVARPELVGQLIEGPDAPPPSENALASLLIAWLDNSVESASATTTADTLAAVHSTATRWWPEGNWQERAPGLVLRFVEIAMSVAEEASVLPTALRARLALPWASALRFAGTSASDGGETDAVESDNRPEPVAAGGQTPLRSEEELFALAESLGTAKRRIWVVGRLSTDWRHLMGVAKTLGCDRGLFTHVDYEEVQRRSMIHRVNVGTDVGILVGPVPHSAAGVGDHSSPVAQLRAETGLPVFEMRAHSRSQELQITKTSFRGALTSLLTVLAAEGSTGSIAA